MTKAAQTKADLKLLKSLGVKTKNLILRANRTYEYKGSSTWAYSLDQYDTIEVRTAYYNYTKPIKRWNRQMRRKWLGKNFLDFDDGITRVRLMTGQLISLNDKINLKRDYQECHWGKGIKLKRFRDNYISYGSSKYMSRSSRYQDILLGGRVVGILISRDVGMLKPIREIWQVCLPDNLIEGCDRVMESEDEGYSMCQFGDLESFYQFIKKKDVLDYLIEKNQKPKPIKLIQHNKAKRTLRYEITN